MAELLPDGKTAGNVIVDHIWDAASRLANTAKGVQPDNEAAVFAHTGPAAKAASPKTMTITELVTRIFVLRVARGFIVSPWEPSLATDPEQTLTGTSRLCGRVDQYVTRRILCQADPFTVSPQLVP
jgi:hypothetical protein